MSLTLFLSGFTDEELEAILWGLLDGDGSKAKERKAVELRTHSWIEAVQSCWIANRLYRVSGVTRYDGTMKIRWSSSEMWEMWNNKWFNHVATYNPLPYLVGLFYAEGRVEHELRIGIRRSRLRFERLRIACFPRSRYARRLKKVLDKLKIPYSYDGKNVYIPSKEWAVRILEYCPLNYRFFRYLLLKETISLGIWVVSTALDYYVFHEMLRIRVRHPTRVYPRESLEDFDLEILELADVRVPRVLFSTRPLNLYYKIGVGTYYDILDLTSRIVEKTFGREEIGWVDVVYHYVEKLSEWYRDFFYKIRSILEIMPVTISPALREAQRRVKHLL